jgi:zinc protease
MLPSNMKKKAVKQTAKTTEQAPEKLDAPDGVPLIYYKDKTYPLVDISIILPGGTIFEGKERSGITRITAAMLTAGTQKYTEEQLAELLENNAVNLSISEGNNTLTFKINCHKDSLPAALDALTSILKEPLFPEDILEREKNIAVERLKTRALSPMSAAEDKLKELFYGKHPYSCPTSGLEESIKKLSSADIRNFFRNVIMNKGKAVIGIAGSIRKEEACKAAAEIINSASWSEAPDASLPEPPVFPAKPLKAEPALPKEQSVVMIGMPGYNMKSEDRFAMELIQVALNGFSSRLFKTIRDDAGLAYYTGVYSITGLHDGIIAFYTGTSPEAADTVLDITLSEKKKLAGKGLTKKEFTSALARLKSEYASHKMNPGMLIAVSALSEFYGNDFMEPWTILEKYESLTLKQVNKIVKKYFSTKNTVTVITRQEG